MESYWSIPNKDESIDQDELGIKQKVYRALRNSSIYW